MVGWLRLGPLAGRSQVPGECSVLRYRVWCASACVWCLFPPPKLPPIGSERLESGCSPSGARKIFLLGNRGGGAKNIVVPLNDGATRGAVEWVALASRT